MTTQGKLSSHLKYRRSSFRHEIGEDMNLESWLLGEKKQSLRVGILKSFLERTDMNGSVLSCEGITQALNTQRWGTRQ